MVVLMKNINVVNLETKLLDVLADDSLVPDGWAIVPEHLLGDVCASITQGGVLWLDTDGALKCSGGAPTQAHEWNKTTQKWVLNKTKQAELSAQAEQQAVESVKHALQAHIDAVAAGLGFSSGNAVMLYAGFANAFQSLAQAFGAWEAGIWAQANQYMGQVKVGDAPMLTPEQAVERVPSFAFAGA